LPEILGILFLAKGLAATCRKSNVLNLMHLATPASAILSAVIFNALIIIALIPLALKGVLRRCCGTTS
jgi:K+-transporting ATPase ATPase B chain